MTARFWICLIILMTLPATAYAGKDDIDLNVPMPELTPGSVMIDYDDQPPKEPNIVEISYLKIYPPRSLKERVNRLVHGITMDVPPEYDHYGYEIRRYMATVGNPKVFTDEAFLIEQIKNVRKARVVLRYWQKHIQEEMEQIEKEIEDVDAGSGVRTAYKQNRQETRSFFVDAQSWVDSNERLLMSVFDVFGYVQIEYPELIFLRPHQRIDFYNAFQARQFKLKEIRRYQSFTIMVY